MCHVLHVVISVEGLINFQRTAFTRFDKSIAQLQICVSKLHRCIHNQVYLVKKEIPMINIESLEVLEEPPNLEANFIDDFHSDNSPIVDYYLDIETSSHVTYASQQIVISCNHFKQEPQQQNYVQAMGLVSLQPRKAICCIDSNKYVKHVLLKRYV